MKTGEWFLQHTKAVEALKAAQAAIDSLACSTEDVDVDARLCFADNTIEGALALLREAAAIALRRHDEKARKPTIGKPEERLVKCPECGWIYAHGPDCSRGVPVRTA